MDNKYPIVSIFNFYVSVEVLSTAGTPRPLVLGDGKVLVYSNFIRRGAERFWYFQIWSQDQTINERYPGAVRGRY